MEVAFGGLYRGVAERELNLLEGRLAAAGEVREGAPQVFGIGKTAPSRSRLG